MRFTKEQKIVMLITLSLISTLYSFFNVNGAKKVTTIEAHSNTLKSTKKVTSTKKNIKNSQNNTLNTVLSMNGTKKVTSARKWKNKAEKNTFENNSLTPEQVKNYKIYYHKFKSPVIIEKHKLMWFLNPKAASVTTRTLLARMMNQQVNPGVTKYKDLLNFKKLREYPVEKATEFLNSPEWTRVIILRDPKERILSAYLDKEQNYHNGNKTTLLREACCNDDSMRWMEDCKNHKFNFSEFLNATKTCAVDNRHWKSQYENIDDWSVINFPINFKNLANDTEVMLRKLGNNVWQEFGATGYGINGTSAIFKENTHHATGAKTKIDTYYTPTIENTVEKRFSKDYDLLRDYFPSYY